MTDGARHRSRGSRLWLALVATLLAAGFVGLGLWQLERREWKHALIEAVETRAHGDPVAAPGPEIWDDITADNAAYMRVRAIGHFRHDKETLVQAVTERGGGYWVMTPLDTGMHSLLVNRGFVPFDKSDPKTRVAGNIDGEMTVTGLLRITEPDGGFLRSNDPKADRWYSRDVAAIARARSLADAAPYFVDADAVPNAGGYPIGGLTVIDFSDNHMAYALTWFAMALLAGWAAWYLLHMPRSEPDSDDRD